MITKWQKKGEVGIAKYFQNGSNTNDVLEIFTIFVVISSILWSNVKLKSKRSSKFVITTQFTFNQNHTSWCGSFGYKKKLKFGPSQQFSKFSF